MGIELVDAVFRKTDPNLWIVTAGSDGERAGLVAGLVASASIVPELPRVVVGIGGTRRTWELIAATGVFALHWIGPERADWIERFATTSSRDVDKFAGLRVETHPPGVPVLTDAPARLVCRVEGGWDLGDRTLFLGAVEDVVCADPAALVPLSMSRAAPSLSPATLRRLAELRASDAAGDAERIRRRRNEQEFQARSREIS